MKKLLYGLEDQEKLDLNIEDTIEIAMDTGVRFPLKIYAWKRLKIDSIEKLAKNILEDALTQLDEEYGDPDGNYTEPTEKMEKAANKLANIIVSEYEVFYCEKTGGFIEISSEEDITRIENWNFCSEEI